MVFSFFRKRSGKYDLIKAQALYSGIPPVETIMTSTIGRAFVALKRKFSPLLKKQPALTDNEQFYLALHREQLLKENTYHVVFVKKRKKSSSILQICPVNDHPVLNICLGFQTKELVSSDQVKLSGSSWINRVNRVRYGIDRVLLGNYECEPSIRGVPMMLVLDTLEPAFDIIEGLENKRRNNKGRLTKRRQKLRLRPGYNRFPLMGDSLLMHNHWGPMMMPDPDRMLQVFSTRFGELGERHRRARHVHITDPVIPTPATLNRSVNHCRFRFTAATPRAQRNSRELEQPEENDDDLLEQRPLPPQIRLLNVEQFLNGFQARVQMQRLVFH